jgi:hypothetical protein
MDLQIEIQIPSLDRKMHRDIIPPNIIKNVDEDEYAQYDGSESRR